MPREYNGWPTYQTWLVYVWLTNDQHSDALCRRLARMTSSVAQTATALKTYVEESSPLDATSGLHVDLLTSAYNEVEWEALAHAFRQLA